MNTEEAALAACGAGGDATSPFGGGGNASGTIRISDYPALNTVGGVALVTLSGVPVAVVRTDTSAYVALSRVCPHQGSIVNPTSNGFLCPNHGAQFTKTGTWVGGQPTNNLTSLPTAYDASAGTLKIG